MISKRFGLILFSSSFSAFKHIPTKFRSLLFKIEATLPKQRLFFQISRKYTTKIEHKNQMGQQNVFYFEESKLLETIEDANDSNYVKLRETLPVVLLLGWTGGKDAHLKKYSDLYSSLGYHTIRFSPSDYTT
jgi:hypothetical protein